MSTRLNDAQREALEPFIKGARVHDLGSGDLVVTRELVRMGAEHVTAIDRHPARSYNQRVTCIEAHFENYREDVDVAFMGYPVNWSCGLAEIAAHARIVVYVGKNTDGTSCGSQALFEHLVDREVLVHVPDRCNTLIVYGPARVERDRLPEEHAKLTEDDKMWPYEELSQWTPGSESREE